MPYTVVEIGTDPEAEFNEFVPVEWAAYEEPYSKLIRLFFPVFGSDSNARAVALKESIERQISWFKEDPTSHWIKAVDTKTGLMAGGACWHIFEENAYANVSEDECTWFPPGESREMANSLMEQFVTPRMQFMAKPHIFLEICFVHPDYRRHGIGTLLMEWGLRKADEMGLETYINATEAGIPLYEASGFLKAGKIDFIAEKDKPSQLWKELREQLLPFSFWPMWRPVNGKMPPGRQAPWDSTA